MGEHLRTQLKLTEALRIYLEVCFLDLNDANNVGGYVNDPELLKQFPPFDPKRGFLAPAVVERIQRIIQKLALKRKDVRALFFENERIQRDLRLPLSVNAAWKKLEKEFVFD